MKKSWLYLIASLLFSLLFSLSAAAEVNAADILPDPGNLVNYRGQNNQSFRFYVTGDESSGSIWGDGIYTDDSSLSLAAVHSGFLKNGQKGVVTVTILPGQSSYSSSTKNGITSSSYNEWEGSYRIDGAEIADGAIPASGDVIADPGTLSSIEAEINTTLKISLTGDISGRIWGTDIYTDDTTLAVAAVHAGLLRVGQSGILDVTILQGQDSYQGSTKNGITSDSYGSWGRSFKFGTSPAPVQTPAPTTPPAATPTPAPPAPSPTPIPVPDGTVPTSNSIEAFGSGVRLTWGGQALGYRIFRSESETDLGISITDFYITSSRFADVNVKPDTTYYYKVKAVISEAKPFEGIEEQLGPVIASFTIRTPSTLVSEPGKLKNFLILQMDNPYMSINGLSEEIDPGRGTTPLIISSRTMVPIRAVIEAMSGTVLWDEATKQITMTARGIEIKMWLNKTDIQINGVMGSMDVAPQIVNGRTFVPVRFAAENLDSKVEWLNSTKEAIIVFTDK